SLSGNLSMQIDKEEISKLFGIVIKELRAKKKISQENLALEAEMARSYLSELERGVKQPTLSTIVVLSRALGVRPSKMVLYFEKSLKEK
ncbi:helix-turn-helix transcriptional regulator, partial [Bacteriovoracaceae bacterium]|nr:helix-turn-helix transcriptional regulator [Bacteriovoracaceae bacterium]